MTRVGLICFAAFMSLTVVAHAATCDGSSIFIKGWGCVKKTEVLRAIQNCNAVPNDPKNKVDFTDCLCQDGKDIGACGD